MPDYIKQYQYWKRLLKELEDKAPDTVAGFESLSRHAKTDGALTARTKELIALALTVESADRPAISQAIHNVVDSGASDEEIVEAIEVAVMMGGRLTLIHACDALEALKQFRGKTQATRLYESSEKDNS